MTGTALRLAIAIDGFVAALFVIAGLGVIVARQMRGSLYLFVFHAMMLSASAVVLAVSLDSSHLAWVAAINFTTKVVAVPVALVWATGDTVFGRREVDHVLSIPQSLLIAAAMAFVAWIVAQPLADAVPGRPFAAINLPVGLMAVLFGAFTIAVRREAVAQLIGLLVMESGAFFASIAIVHDLPIIAEIAAAVDVPIATLVIGLLIRSIRSVTGTTRVGHLASLHERDE